MLQSDEVESGTHTSRQMGISSPNEGFLNHHGDAWRELAREGKVLCRTHLASNSRNSKAVKVLLSHKIYLPVNIVMEFFYDN